MLNNTIGNKMFWFSVWRYQDTT